MKAVAFLSLLSLGAQAQITLVSNCTADACLKEILPYFPRSNVPIPALEDCVSWQQTLVTTT